MSESRPAHLGAVGALVVQTGVLGLLFAPFTPSLTVWGLALFCNIGGWIALWLMLYIMTKQK